MLPGSLVPASTRRLSQRSRHRPARRSFLSETGRSPTAPRRPGVDVLFVEVRLEGRRFGAAARDAVREPAGREQEAGVADHAVVRADGEALEVPAADHGFPGVAAR